MQWDELDYWASKDWDVAQQKLDKLEKEGNLLNPSWDNLWKMIDTVDMEKVKVLICGQDPYPNHELCTGIAFHIPADAPYVPPTLRTIIKEYLSDLHYEVPPSVSLMPWIEQGVMLWNVIPVTVQGQSLACDWDEWKSLNMEIIQELDKQGCVFVFLGAKARTYACNVTPEDNNVIELSHPSPRASRAAKHPFLGSRLFSTINGMLISQGLDPIDWRLYAPTGAETKSETNVQVS